MRKNHVLMLLQFRFRMQITQNAGIFYYERIHALKKIK